MNQGVDLWHAQIVGFNANHVPTMLEPPLWQAGAAFAMRALGGWWGGANLFSLAIFALGIFPIYHMGQRLHGSPGAWGVVVAFLAQPLVFEFAGTASPDGMSLVAALWFYDRLRAYALQGGWKRGLVAAGLSVLSATLKLPFFMTAGLAVAWSVLPGNLRRTSLWLRLIAVALVASAVFWGWSRYCDRWFERAMWPLVDLRIGHNPEMVQWYFGDWAYRLSPGHWVKAVWRMANVLVGSFALLGVLAIGYLNLKNREARAWLIGAILTTAVFTHLVFHHWHYYLMFSPAVALALTGGGFWLFDRCFPVGDARRIVAGAAGMILLAASLFQGLVARKIVLQFDPFPGEAAARIAAKTSSHDRLLIAGGGWGGDLLFRSHRDGLSIWNTRFLENPGNLKIAHEKGFTKLVIVRESPLMESIQRGNPGGSGYRSQPFSDYLSPATDKLPVLYQDERLMILDFAGDT